MIKRVIDFHAHVFPEEVAEKAVRHLEEHYKLKIHHTGLLEDLLQSALQENVELLVVHSTATSPSQVENINNWIASIAVDRVVGFGTLHPDYPHYERELDRIKELGLKGIKFHPDFQGFDIDDPKMWPVYRTIGSRFPVLFHTGDENLEHSSPKKLSRVLESFPELRVIAAHLGGYSRWEEAREYLIGKNLYLDTSSSLWKLEPEEAAEIIRSHGVDRVLFGTDYPIASHREELLRFEKLPLTEEEKETILWENARRLLDSL